VKKTHDYIHRYRGYWSDGGRCRIRIYHEDGRAPVVICSQLPNNDNTSVTNMAEYLAAEVIEEHSLPTPLTWIEHYPQHEGEIGEYSLIRFSDWELQEVCLGGQAKSKSSQVAQKNFLSSSNADPSGPSMFLRTRPGREVRS
jgi:hypothetical protein